MKKRFLFFTLLICSVLPLSAGDNWKVGVDAGVALSRIKSYDFKSITSFRVGASVDYIVPMNRLSSFTISSGAYLAHKGGKITDYIDCKVNAYYLDIPIQLGFRQRVSGDFTLFEKIGPYIGFGLFGKTNIGVYVDSNGKQSDNIKFDTFDNFKKVDAGLALNIGVEYNDMIRLTLGFDFGLMKTVKDNPYFDISKGQNMSSYLTLGFVF